MKTLKPTAMSLSVLAATTAAQTCDYYDDVPCIKPDITAQATVPFAPLFSEPPTFMYAIDNLTADDKATIQDKIYGDTPPDGGFTYFAMWLEYPESALNFTPEAIRTYQIAALFTNTSEPVGGSDNSCGNLLGDECVQNLVSTIQTLSVSRLINPLAEALNQLSSRPLRNLSCPDDIFNDPPLVLDTSESFAIESPPQTGDEQLPFSGNSSHVHAAQAGEWSFEEQMQKAVVGMVVGHPNSLDDTLDQLDTAELYSAEDVTVELVCVRVDSPSENRQDSGQGDGEDESNEAGLALRVSGAMVVLWLGAAFFLCEFGF